MLKVVIVGDETVTLWLNKQIFYFKGLGHILKELKDFTVALISL